jgi:hypothetical protein
LVVVSGTATAQLLAAVRPLVESEPVADSVAAKIGAILDRAHRREDQLDAEDALTYHARLVLDNDEDTYADTRRMVREHRAAADPCLACGGTNTAGPGLVGQNTECSYCGPGGTVKRHPHQLCEALRSYAEELAGVDGLEATSPDGIVRGMSGGVYSLNPLAAEPLSTALAWVDWDAIARDYLSESTE